MVRSPLDPGRGTLIVFEGIDGSGKTTQAGLVEDWLLSSGLHVARFKEPTEGQWGRRIARIAANGRDAEGVTPEQEVGFFLDDRREDVSANIAPALSRGDVVVGDRYYQSSICYQGALPGVEPSRVKAMNEKIAPIPDLVMVLAVAPEVGVNRIHEKRGGHPNRFEDIEYLRRVAANFKSLDEYNQVEIDGARTPEGVFEGVRAAIERTLAFMRSGEFQKRLCAHIQLAWSNGRDVDALARKFIHEVYLSAGGRRFEWREHDDGCSFVYPRERRFVDALDSWAGVFKPCGIDLVGLARFESD